MENDQLNLICTKLLNIKRVSFIDMNKVIAHCLSSILLPYGHSKCPSRQDVRWFAEPLSHLCSHPSYKLLNIKAVPQVCYVTVN